MRMRLPQELSVVGCTLLLAMVGYKTLVLQKVFLPNGRS